MTHCFIVYCEHHVLDKLLPDQNDHDHYLRPRDVITYHSLTAWITVILYLGYSSNFSKTCINLRLPFSLTIVTTLTVFCVVLARIAVASPIQ